MSETDLNNKLDIELKSDEIQEMLTKTPHWILKWGNMLILFLILILLTIAWLIKYPDIITADALVTTSIPTLREYAQVSGIIDTILVEDDKLVLPNEKLAVLENSANYEDVYLLKSIIDTINSNNVVSFPIDNLKDLNLGEIDSNFGLFANSYSLYVLNLQLNPYGVKGLTNKGSISQLERRLISLKNQREIQTTELDIVTTDFKRNQELFNNGVIAQQEFENKEITLLNAQRAIENIEISISQIEEAISNTKYNSKEIFIDRARDEMMLYSNVLQSLSQLKKSINEWELKYIIKSRISGYVNSLDFWTQSQSISQGDALFSIIPVENSHYIAQLKTLALNLGKINLKQKVNIKLDNFQEAEYGFIIGSVEGISRVADKEGLYKVEVSLPDRLITTYNKEIRFKSEMNGFAEIITDDLRIIDRFFYQIKSLLIQN